MVSQLLQSQNAYTEEIQRLASIQVGKTLVAVCRQDTCCLCRVLMKHVPLPC